MFNIPIFGAALYRVGLFFQYSISVIYFFVPRKSAVTVVFFSALIETLSGAGMGILFDRACERERATRVTRESEECCRAAGSCLIILINRDKCHRSRETNHFCRHAIKRNNDR